MAKADQSAPIHDPSDPLVPSPLHLIVFVKDNSESDLRMSV
jgi:hypothetical protein